MKDFSAKKVSISDLFEQRIQYRIPSYQRPYSWEKEYITNFWSYLKDDSEGYFLGTIVLNIEPLEIDKCKDIVDGQQRLVTAAILLAVIRDKLIELNEIELASAIQADAISLKDRNWRDLGFRLIPWKKVEDYFSINIQRMPSAGVGTIENWKTAEEKRVFANYRLFLDCLEKDLEGKGHRDKIKYLQDTRDSLLDLELVLIEVASEDDAYIFFESINATWMKLSTADILKNLLFKKTELPSDGLTEKWNELLEILGGQKGDFDITRYIRHYWLSKHEKVGNRRIYLSIKSAIDAKTNPAYGWSYDVFLDELIEKARLYKQILRPNLEEMNDILGDENKAKRVTRSLFWLKALWVVQPHPLLLSLIDKIRKPYWLLNEAIELFSIIEHFTFVYSTVAGKIPSKLEKIYSKSAIKISESGSSEDFKKSIEECVNDLKKEFPKQTEFDVNFDEIRYSKEHKGTLNYLLWKLNHWGYSEVALDNVNIEHVFPQNPPRSMNDVRVGEILKVVNDIWNLTLVNPHLNRIAGNKSILEKLSVYEGSAVGMTKDLISEVKDGGGIWGVEQIMARSQRMKEEAWGIFSKKLV